ncbi:hypothetical protein CROQUDRAFT_656751 [Cronartium quercuum f. sp. fusiforme G11]|uniref:Uncharacterized protein n=1 Tax=Cronartium quercuum f. sp. fusiforme G11 TaxID=708437 RepID=A0A9P6NMV8_9BASI|nr:hypothetical protein CROQUDRAFT_656751 [Cronartium quercuum f. sp. fusiforme G11]
MSREPTSTSLSKGSNVNQAEGESSAVPSHTTQADDSPTSFQSDEQIHSKEKSSSGAEEAIKSVTNTSPDTVSSTDQDRVSTLTGFEKGGREQVQIHPNVLQSISNSSPQLPPRLHPTDLEMISSPYPEISRANQSILCFMGTLSRWFLYSGTLSGIIVIFYQRYIFPSLEARTRALTTLTNFGLKCYVNILNRLLELPRSCSMLLIKSAKEVERERDKPFPSDVTITNEDDQPNSITADEKPGLSRPISPSTPVYDYRDSIHQSLGRLADSLRRREMNKPNKIPEDHQEPDKVSNNSSTISVTRSLSRTLERLREEIHLIHSNRQDFSSSSRYISPLFNDSDLLGSSSPHIPDQYERIVNEFKRELRSLKGMLLNRRNFASWN